MKFSLASSSVVGAFAAAMIAPSTVQASPFAISNVNDGLPITLTLDSFLLSSQNHNNIIITLSDLVATGGLDIPSLKRDVTNQTVSLDIQSVNLWSQSGNIVNVVTMEGDSASATVSVAKLTPTYISSGLGTWGTHANESWSVSLAELEAKGALAGNTVTLYADFNVVDSGLLSGWSWGGGLSGNINYTTVPELASFSVLGLGSVGLMLLRRK